jgi:predicted nucleic acid-binding protein
MIFVDSSVWIDYFNGKGTLETDTLDRLLDTGFVATGDLILVEILQGFRGDEDYAIAKRLLSSLIVFNMLDIDIAVKGADAYRQLRKKGITVRKTIDTLIAAFCIQNDFPLLHSDKDFQPFQKYLRLKTVL